MVEKAKHAEDGIDQFSDKAHSTVDQVQSQVHQGATKASEKIVPLAADASDALNSVRCRFAARQLACRHTGSTRGPAEAWPAGPALLRSTLMSWCFVLLRQQQQQQIVVASIMSCQLPFRPSR